MSGSGFAGGEPGVRVPARGPRAPGLALPSLPPPRRVTQAAYADPAGAGTRGLGLGPQTYYLEIQAAGPTLKIKAGLRPGPRTQPRRPRGSRGPQPQDLTALPSAAGSRPCSAPPGHSPPKPRWPQPRAPRPRPARPPGAAARRSPAAAPAGLSARRPDPLGLRAFARPAGKCSSPSQPRRAGTLGVRTKGSHPEPQFTQSGSPGWPLLLFPPPQSGVVIAAHS